MTNDSRASEHARILANIAAQVARQYTTGSGGKFTQSQDNGQVPVPEQQHSEDWDWTLDERYRP